MMWRMLGLMAIILYSAVCNADVSGNWKTECVGRYQIGLPGEMEVATNKPASYKGSTNQASFSDGQNAPYSQLKYFGDLRIISPASDSDFSEYKKNVSSSLVDLKKVWLHSSSESVKKSAQAMKSMTYDTPTMFGWDSKDYLPSLYYFLDNKIFAHTLTNYELDDIESRALNVKHFNNFLTNFRLRALYELPKQPGICIPYGFIPDSGTEPHAISVTMRLKDHPDIEVALRDTTYTENTYRDGKSIQAYLDPKETINDFFAISELSNSEEKQELNFPGLHTVQMNGQKGGAVFVTITRADGSKDYGYVATVQGTADTPTLLLYVIRTASRAKGKPVSKDELKDMAEKIVASVKRHAVQ